MSLARAISTGELAELPSRRQEDWRWTDLRGLVRSLPPPSAAGEARRAGPFATLADREVVIVNGRGAEPVMLAPGESRVVALRIVAAQGAGAHAARILVNVGAGASLTLLESYEGETAEYLSEFDLDIRVAEGARLERIVLADEAADAVSVSLANVEIAPGASLAQTVVGVGAKRQRLETRVMHKGGGAAARLDGVYVLEDKRHSDLTTAVTHEAVGGATDQLIKGIVRDQARSVFQGRITVARGADKTDARMGHHALVLSDRAEVDAKPELEIFADDVACAHGNSVGALDEDALFYACARGLPEDAARALLTAAFLAEVIDRIENQDAREVVRSFVEARLEGAS
ncbi:MAG TPA: Fe-S cluster assembly protein SufD [Caulobacteraceae bacterium]|nr:Fe-S cluster assembly protein SufD [Caulobacteraceae bacterium]